MKILKNLTLSPISIQSIGKQVPASGELQLDAIEYLVLGSQDALSEIDALIDADDLILNDGSQDLSKVLSKAFLRYPDRARSVLFDNSTNGFTSKEVQSAIEESKGLRFQYAQFQLIGKLDFSEYIYSFHHLTNNGARRSGNRSNGYQFSNSAPLAAAFSGNIGFASASIRGIAQSTGTPAANLEMLFELWKVGFSSQGTKLGDIVFNINSSLYTIGNFWNASIVTGFAERQTQNVDVTAGDLLGLKFIRRTGADRVVAFENATIVLEIVGNA